MSLTSAKLLSHRSARWETAFLSKASGAKLTKCEIVKPPYVLSALTQVIPQHTRRHCGKLHIAPASQQSPLVTCFISEHCSSLHIGKALCSEQADRTQLRVAVDS